jgi:hypothetical protein
MVCFRFWLSALVDGGGGKADAAAEKADAAAEKAEAL